MPEFDQTVFSQIPNLRLKSNAQSASQRDQEITDEWLKFTRVNKKNKFFGFLFYDSVHNYDVPAGYPIKFEPYLDVINYFLLNNEYDPTAFFNRYKTSLNYVDSLIKNVIEDLKQNRLLDKTIILITSDHGEEFNDNKQNYWGHNSNFSKAQTQVPLIIHWPNSIRKDLNYSHRTSHYDISATLLSELASCSGEEILKLSTGKNLFSKQPSKYIIQGTSGNWALLTDSQILRINPSGKFEVLDLKYHSIENENFNFDEVINELKVLDEF